MCGKYFQMHILKVIQHTFTKRRRMPGGRKRHILTSQQCNITFRLCIYTVFRHAVIFFCASPAVLPLLT